MSLFFIRYTKERSVFFDGVEVSPVNPSCICEHIEADSHEDAENIAIISAHGGQVFEVKEVI